MSDISKDKLIAYLPYIAWAQAFAAMATSLYFSDVLHIPPCNLCWLQRIFMYPLVFILAVGITRKDKNMVMYSLPLALIGWLIATYHVLLQWGIVQESILLCSVGVPCKDVSFAIFGIFTIPFLSFMAFTLILSCLFVYWKGTKTI